MPDDDFPLRLDKKSIALRYVQEIRDEAHRFAITYNRYEKKESYNLIGQMFTTVKSIYAS